MKTNASKVNTYCTSIGFFLLLLGLMLAPTGLKAQEGRKEYRAYWAETFNTQMGTRTEIDRLVDSAVQSNANAIFAQVRRRGDSWYLDTKEPLTQVTGVGEPDASGNWTIDPLRYLIEQSHARGIEVHAFVIVGSIYNAHPTSTGRPRDPNHVFNKNFWDTATNTIIPFTDPRQWSTRSLPHNPDGTTFNGQRYGAEWYVDLGHPGAAAHTVDVLTHLVKKYDLDGLHLDRIRYPEAPIDRPAGQPLGINTGYNETSVQRFKARYGDQAAYYQESDIGTNVGTAAAPRLIHRRRCRLSQNERSALEQLAARTGDGCRAPHLSERDRRQTADKSFGGIDLLLDGSGRKRRLGKDRSLLQGFSGLAFVGAGRHTRHYLADDLQARTFDDGTRAI